LNAPGGTVVTGVWTHIAAVRNGSDLRIYKDGISVASKTTSATSFGDSTNAYGIGRMTGSLARNVNGYLQDFRVYKGVAKYTSNFNPPSSTQNATVAAGNDSLVDVPTNGSETDTGVGGEVRGNYCTWNPLNNPAGSTFANGNLDCTTASGNKGRAVGTIAVSSGKWYWEVVKTGGSAAPVFGFTPASESDTTYPKYSYYGGLKSSDYFNTYSSYGADFGTNDVIGVALDLDAGTCTFYKNGASQGQAFSGLSGTFVLAIADDSNSNTIDVTLNAGARSFAYTAPSGFKALCTANLPAPVITKPSDLFDVKLYTGNGSTQTISGLGFSPDFIWIKSRSAAYDHQLADVVRGVGNILHSNLTAAESTLNTITGTTSDGFTVSAASFIGTNANSQTFAAWCWDAGSSTVTNTQGSITSQVRANASAGFSIVTYTGTGANATIGHGLGVAPSLIIGKARSISQVWVAGHTSIGWGNYLLLNATDASASGANVWNNTAPTSTVFSLGTGAGLNTSSATYVAYCFAPVAGYSSFGSYTGNGQSGDSAPFVWTGFRPRWIMIKISSTTGWWGLWDTARAPYNVFNYYAPAANSSAAEVGTTGYELDILSNGFKCRGFNDQTNPSGATVIYAAFAESPFQYARAR
jgi:hypothetical protein